jgi:hypothetical protein
VFVARLVFTHFRACYFFGTLFLLPQTVLGALATAYALPYWSTSMRAGVLQRVGVWQLCIKGGACSFIDSTALWESVRARVIVARVFGALSICMAIIPVFIHTLLVFAKRRGQRFDRQRKLRLRQWSWGAGIAELVLTVVFGVPMATTAEDPDAFGPAVYLTIGAWVSCAALLAAVDRKMAATAAKEARRNLGEEIGPMGKGLISHASVVTVRRSRGDQ